MKKLVCFLAVLALCLSFAGCKELDELRAQRAYVVEDGVIAMTDGTQFKRLPKCQELYFERNDYGLLYLVEEEMPLLLTSFGDSITKSDDGRFLKVYEEGDRRIYCREDVYDAVVQRIEKGFTPEVYAYDYWDDETGESSLYKLTPEQAAAVEQVFSQEPEQLPAAATIEYYYLADLYHYSSDFLFREDAVDVCVVEEEYFLWDDEDNIYTVPQELVPIFKEIMKAQMD